MLPSFETQLAACIVLSYFLSWRDTTEKLFHCNYYVGKTVSKAWLPSRSHTIATCRETSWYERMVHTDNNIKAGWYILRWLQYIIGILQMRGNYKLAVRNPKFGFHLFRIKEFIFTSVITANIFQRKANLGMVFRTPAVQLPQVHNWLQGPQPQLHPGDQHHQICSFPIFPTTLIPGTRHQAGCEEHALRGPRYRAAEQLCCN